ncbi:MAG TPA: hypothetical protein VKB60_09400 [Terriglobales bacterium]|jgi:type II secretory pathway component PulJ|nr:hypothetical protein [Terriglobales bacterium]
MNEVLALVAFFALLALLLSRMLRQIGQQSTQPADGEEELLTSLELSRKDTSTSASSDLTVHSPGSKR